MCPRHCATTILVVACSIAVMPPGLHAQEKKPRRKTQLELKTVKGDKGLSITGAVVCRTIDGYENYKLLVGPQLTSDEKLLVYYLPFNYKVVSRGNEYLAHFTQDGQIRRKGEKQVLLRKKNMMDYEAKSTVPPEQVFIKNSFSLKGLSPGEYEYDIILRDENEPGSTVTQTVKFRVVAPVVPKAVKDKKPASSNGRTRPCHQIEAGVRGAGCRRGRGGTCTNSSSNEPVGRIAARTDSPRKYANTSHPRRSTKARHSSQPTE